MFKKRNEEIYERLNKLLKEEISYVYNRLKDMERTNGEYKSTIESKQYTIEELTNTIKQLTNALCNKYEHGLFVFSEDCKVPMVIRNGKEITNDMTESFSIDWTAGEVPRIDINITQFVGTRRNSDY